MIVNFALDTNKIAAELGLEPAAVTAYVQADHDAFVKACTDSATAYLTTANLPKAPVPEPDRDKAAEAVALRTSEP